MRKKSRRDADSLKSRKESEEYRKRSNNSSILLSRRDWKKRLQQIFLEDYKRLKLLAFKQLFHLSYWFNMMRFNMLHKQTKADSKLKLKEISKN